MVTSTLASVPMNEIAECNSAGNWFQLYMQTNPQDTLTLIRQAEQAGYDTIVLTVDAPVTGLRNRPQRAGFVLPTDVAAVNCQDFEAGTLIRSGGDSPVLHGIMAHAPQWRDIEWLRNQTALPLLVKGISHPDDALQAKALGADALVVSNHGGRTLDTAPASIDMLPPIRAVVGNDYPLLLDSGVRRGSDIVKALALGANAVMIGRPQIFSLAVAGSLGVAHMLRLLREELEITMALIGCPTIDSIDANCIHHTGRDTQCY
jgi:isopentenyl diphosphate isomerase/L-lactate dehydrogenase-like FMN-dependent dehydrogenase